jgi:hypothetical protein
MPSFSVVVGVLLLFGAWWWDAKLQARQDALETAIADRQDDLAKAIADRQDDLARDLANQAEVLENTRFVRQIATSEGDTPKPFGSINLRGAELGGLQLQCTDVRRHVGCADFREADLGEANLRSTDLRGAEFTKADLHKATLDVADFSGAKWPISAGRGARVPSSVVLIWTAPHWSKPNLGPMISDVPASLSARRTKLSFPRRPLTTQICAGLISNVLT